MNDLLTNVRINGIYSTYLLRWGPCSATPASFLLVAASSASFGKLYNDVIASDACLVAAEGLLCIAGILVVDERISALEGQLVDVPELREFLHEVFAPDVAGELADVELRLARD